MRLALPVRRYVAEHVAANGFRLLDIALAHLGRLETLAMHHRDPFDRLLDLIFDGDQARPPDRP